MSATSSLWLSPTRLCRRAPPRRPRGQVGGAARRSSTWSGRSAGCVADSFRRPGNVAFDVHLGDRVENGRRHSRGPARVVRINVVNPRLVANFLETRAAVAEYDSGNGQRTLLRRQPGRALSATIWQGYVEDSTDKLRVITTDVGGGFGVRHFTIGNIRSCSRRRDGSVAQLLAPTERSISSAIRRGAIMSRVAEMALD